MIEVPGELAANHLKYPDDSGPSWTAALPGVAQHFLDAWDLRVEGPSMHGIVSLVLPVRQADGSHAALKLQPATEENVTEGPGLRQWDGDGIVRLLREDTLPLPGHDGNALLLERLVGERSLESVPDTLEAMKILTSLLARLVVHPAPAGMRRLADIAQGMLDDVPHALEKAHPDDRRWLDICAGAVRELVGEPGDRLLHWDLHFDNVLAAEREPWLAIDPKPLAGDPGFDLLPALDNRWDDVVATGDVARAVRVRFDLMVDGLGLDRQRAVGWTLGRVLQNALWDIKDGEERLNEEQLAIADALLHRP
ncbi:aminoglycoside phosphotransferase family protein [Nonomuraea sp. NPDC050556]|uniref:aminoglycoside phosphotransferase family protein n=1 Tax=Nonomuraea sp. NPDC050556 TaxID=3364369 RepID=UPI003788613C